MPVNQDFITPALPSSCLCLKQVSTAPLGNPRKAVSLGGVIQGVSTRCDQKIWDGSHDGVIEPFLHKVHLKNNNNGTLIPGEIFDHTLCISPGSPAAPDRKEMLPKESCLHGLPGRDGQANRRPTYFSS